MAWRHKDQPGPPPRPAAPPTVRVLHGDAELAAATERAAEGQRRLEARLEARAARDAWTAQRKELGRQGPAFGAPQRGAEHAGAGGSPASGTPTPRTPAA